MFEVVSHIPCTIHPDLQANLLAFEEEATTAVRRKIQLEQYR